MNLRLDPSGHVAVVLDVYGAGLVTERFYPMCGDAVQTEVFDGHHEVRVRPDTYTKRTVTKKYGP